MAELLRFFTEKDLVTAAFVIGAIAVVIAILGKIEPYFKPTASARLGLALFGIALMGISFLSWTASRQPSLLNPPEKQTTTAIDVPTPSDKPISRNTVLPPTVTSEPPTAIHIPPEITKIPQAFDQLTACDQKSTLPPIPKPPPPGCVLTVEWWYPKSPGPCGLWVTNGSVTFKEGVSGSWWYEHATTVQEHIQAFQARQTTGTCEVKDFR